MKGGSLVENYRFLTKCLKMINKWENVHQEQRFTQRASGFGVGRERERERNDGKRNGSCKSLKVQSWYKMPTLVDITLYIIYRWPIILFAMVISFNIRPLNDIYLPHLRFGMVASYNLMAFLLCVYHIHSHSHSHSLSLSVCMKHILHIDCSMEQTVWQCFDTCTACVWWNWNKEGR